MSVGSKASADPARYPLVIDDDIIYLGHIVHVELQYEDLKKASLNFPPSVRITFVGGYSVEFSGDRADRLRNWFKNQGDAVVL
jgi:hypothetical protein